MSTAQAGELIVPLMHHEKRASVGLGTISVRLPMTGGDNIWPERAASRVEIACTSAISAAREWGFHITAFCVPFASICTRRTTTERNLVGLVFARNGASLLNRGPETSLHVVLILPLPLLYFCPPTARTLLFSAQ